MNAEKIGLFLVSVISSLVIIFVWTLGPIPQDIDYHHFVDQRIYFGISNFWNVMSNLPFLFVGILGLHGLFLSRNVDTVTEKKLPYAVFFIGVLLIALGSSFYHLSPSNESLVWDRLPMTVSFMALFSIVVSEFISIHLGKIIFWPLIGLGIFSVIYWLASENVGQGDLRLYILVQLLPILTIPLILLFFRKKGCLTKGYWVLLFAYIVAKFLEYFDAEIYNVFFLVSGHSLKHVVAALGILYWINFYCLRKKN